MDNSFKSPMQPTTTKLNTANGSPMTALGMTAPHLRIGDFKLIHNFVICDKLLHTEVIFGIDIQSKCSLSYAWDKDIDCYIQIEGRFLTYINNVNRWQQKETCQINP